MKNKFLIFFLILLFNCNVSFSEQFVFETSELEIIDDGNIKKKKNGKAFSADKNIEIEADKLFKFKIYVRDGQNHIKDRK